MVGREERHCKLQKFSLARKVMKETFISHATCIVLLLYLVYSGNKSMHPSWLERPEVSLTTACHLQFLVHYFYCETPVLQGTKDVHRSMKVHQPREVQWFQLSLLSTFLALKYFLSQQDHMLFLFPLFFAWHLKNCTPDSKEIFFFLWERQETTERDSGQCSTWFRMPIRAVFRPHSCTHIESQCDLPNQDEPLPLLIRDYIYEIKRFKNQWMDGRRTLATPVKQGRMQKRWICFVLSIMLSLLPSLEAAEENTGEQRRCQPDTPLPPRVRCLHAWLW